MKIPYFCCIGAELKRYAKDFDFMNQVYLYKVPADDTIEEVLAQDYFQAVADTVLQDDIVYIYEPTTEMLYTCHFNKQNGHITAEQMSNNIPSLTPDKILISDATGHITAGDVSLDYIKNQLLAKVNIDGSSIMTGPLKFKAGSFSGAIAGGLGDGISIYKLKADGSIDSEVASLTKTNGFTPGTTNAQNIGSPTLKWKDAHVARVIAAVLNNGYDIAVPVTNGPDTLALKSEVDTAANSGRMITDQGVWYAKMYSASTVPTGAEYDGTNYADFSQTDGDGNPVIKIYTGASGAWTLTDTITPPAEYDGYVPITSKIWDIVEQTNQQGGRILWNHQSKEFTPYPNIVDLSKVATTDMDNLTSTGQNISNWSSNVSNCITNIPQDIKLELSAGTLTLKAGSKLYMPNGVDTFDVITVASDLTIDGGSGSFSGSGTLYYHYTNSSLAWYASSADSSGTTPPSTSNFYNTSTNTVYRYRNDVQGAQLSFPLAHITVTNDVITSIDQVFNGFGYIGSTVFVLPGVKGLIPNGRNADGTLKNKYSYNSTTVKTITPTNGARCICLSPYSAYADAPLANDFYYDKTKNMNCRTSDGVQREYAVCGTFTQTNSGITNFTVKTVFHALDYNDTEYIPHQAMPSGRGIDLTLGASGASYTAPADGYIYLNKTASAVNQIITIINDDNGMRVSDTSVTASGWIATYLPVSKGQSIRITYTAGGTTNTFQFIYANGAQ